MAFPWHHRSRTAGTSTSPGAPVPGRAVRAVAAQLRWTLTVAGEHLLSCSVPLRWEDGPWSEDRDPGHGGSGLVDLRAVAAPVQGLRA